MKLIEERRFDRLNVDDNLNCFHSYVSLNSFPFYRFFNKDQLTTQIVLNNNITFHGEDPRPFILNGNIYVLSQRFVNTFDDMQNYIVDVNTGEAVLYKVNRENFSYGKNWTPFVCNNELYIIQKFDPLTIIKDGNIIMEMETNLPKFNNFVQYRGGSNGIEIDNGIIVGIGHRTLSLDHHMPFLWRINFNSQKFEIMDIEYKTTERLNDPTSLWVDNLNCKTYLSIFESSCLWSDYPIRCRSLIYEIDIDECIKKNSNGEFYKIFSF